MSHHRRLLLPLLLLLHRGKAEGLTLLHLLCLLPAQQQQQQQQHQQLQASFAALNYLLPLSQCRPSLLPLLLLLLLEQYPLLLLLLEAAAAPQHPQHPLAQQFASHKPSPSFPTPSAVSAAAY
jgi:hypothetical protein